MMEPNRNLLKNFSKYWQDIITELFRLDKVVFDCRLKITLETGNVLKFEDADYFVYDKEILVLTEHDGYYVFNKQAITIKVK